MSDFVAPPTAADIRKTDHPVNAHFVRWLTTQGTADTIRQARKFLAAHPYYKRV